ncbi:MAG: tetratricopeptide repeat protein [Bacteroidales bacterium]|jgi:tetratricopeptide (TPR) repeat protein|nr:tetratricopeptide repeat protein [Bacteroidales bacterium]
MGFFSSLFSPVKSEEDNRKKVDRKNFDILKYDGIRAQRAGKTEYAVKCFTEALKIQADFETMKYLMSACYMLNKPDQALEVLNTMVDAGEEPVSTLLARANLLFTMGMNTEAVADCVRAIEIEPENPLAYFQLAKSEHALGELTKAIGNLENATRLKDDFAEGYALRAGINHTLKNGNDALTDVEKVIELTPEDEMAYLLRGRIHELLGDTDAAFLDYREASELNPFNEEAYLLAGQLMMAQEKYGEAVTLFDEAIEHNEKFAKAYIERAHAKHKTGDHEGALADEEKAGELNESNLDKKEKTAGNHNFDDLYKGNII